VIIRISLSGFSVRSLDMSAATLGSSAIAVPLMRHSRTNATSLIVIVASFVSAVGISSCHGGAPWRTSNARSGCRLRAAEPFVEVDAAEARFAQRHERVLLDAAAEISGLGIAHDLTRIADRLEIASDDF